MSSLNDFFDTGIVPVFKVVNEGKKYIFIAALCFGGSGETGSCSFFVKIDVLHI